MNILLMMTANLIGFAIGTEGMGYMWSQMISTWTGALCSFRLVTPEMQARAN